MRTDFKMLNRSTIKDVAIIIKQRKYLRWFILWLGGMFGLWLWDAFYLNSLSYELICSALVNTFYGASAAVALSLFIGWLLGLASHFWQNGKARGLYLSLMFVLNLIRSIPQIVGLLIGYILLTFFIGHRILESHLSQILWMAFIMSRKCS